MSAISKLVQTIQTTLWNSFSTFFKVYSSGRTSLLKVTIDKRGIFNMFVDFFVHAFKIVIDSWKLNMLLLYMLWDYWQSFMISGSNSNPAIYVHFFDYPPLEKLWAPYLSSCVLNSIRRCPWFNGYRRRKWTRRQEFKSRTWLIAFHIVLIPLGKVWIQ